MTKSFSWILLHKKKTKVTVANWCLKVNFFLSYKRSAWVGSSWLVWQCHNYWWSKVPFCLPVGPYSGLGFHDPSGAAVATSIFYAGGGGRKKGALFHLHLIGQNLVTCNCLGGWEVYFSPLVGSLASSNRISFFFLRKEGYLIGIRSTCCHPSGSGVESCLLGQE